MNAAYDRGATSEQIVLALNALTALQPDPRDAEIARLRSELAEALAEPTEAQINRAINAWFSRKNESTGFEARMRAAIAAMQGKPT